MSCSPGEITETCVLRQYILDKRKEGCGVGKEKEKKKEDYETRIMNVTSESMQI